MVCALLVLFSGIPGEGQVVTGVGFVVSKTRAYWPELFVSHELSSTSARVSSSASMNMQMNRTLGMSRGMCEFL